MMRYEMKKYNRKVCSTSLSRDITIVQVDDCRNNKKYDWINLEFNLVNIKTGAKSEIPITSMFGN